MPGYVPQHTPIHFLSKRKERKEKKAKKQKPPKTELSTWLETFQERQLTLCPGDEAETLSGADQGLAQLNRASGGGRQFQSGKAQTKGSGWASQACDMQFSQDGRQISTCPGLLEVRPGAGASPPSPLP